MAGSFYYQKTSLKIVDQGILAKNVSFVVNIDDYSMDQSIISGRKIDLGKNFQSESSKNHSNRPFTLKLRDFRTIS